MQNTGTSFKVILGDIPILLIVVQQFNASTLQLSLIVGMRNSIDKLGGARMGGHNSLRGTIFTSEYCPGGHYSLRLRARALVSLSGRLYFKKSEDQEQPLLQGKD